MKWLVIWKDHYNMVSSMNVDNAKELDEVLFGLLMEGTKLSSIEIRPGQEVTSLFDHLELRTE